MRQVWQTEDGTVFQDQKAAKAYELRKAYTAEIKVQSVNVAMYADILLEDAQTFIDILQRYINEHDHL